MPLRQTVLSLVSSVCVGVFIPAGRLTLLECQFPFVDPWERSSIALLGTALMRPGILPFIQYSLQLGIAHSFVMATAECLYTDTQCSGPRVPTSAHSPPDNMLIYLEYWSYFSGFVVLTSCRESRCRRYVFLCLPQLKMNLVPENTEEGRMVMICRFNMVYNIPRVQRRTK